MKKEISIKEIKGIRIGQAENAEAGTGCTVFLSEKGMAAGLDVRGGGPASRESQLLNPLAAAQAIHGILLAGGSAFGLGGADGVMKYLEERGIGFEVGPSLKVPLVCQADLFDLTVGDPHIRPDKAMGYEACINAEKDGTGNYRDGNYGAGCGAVVAVNALGDIYDWKTGQKIAGLLAENKKSFRSTEELMYASTKVVENKFTGNTTIGVVLTNGKFHKTSLCKIAGMAHDGFARSIRPVHTSADGGSIYAVSVGNVSADQDLVGTLAGEVMSEAIIRAVESAESAYGYPGLGSWKME